MTDAASAGSNSQEASSLGVQCHLLCASYLAVCTFYSLFCMNIGYDYSLRGSQQSTFFITIQWVLLARLQFLLLTLYSCSTLTVSMPLLSEAFSDMETIPAAL